MASTITLKEQWENIEKDYKKAGMTNEITLGVMQDVFYLGVTAVLKMAMSFSNDDNKFTEQEFSAAIQKEMDEYLSSSVSIPIEERAQT